MRPTFCDERTKGCASAVAPLPSAMGPPLAGFAAGVHSGNLAMAFGAAMLAGVLMSLLFGVLALTLQTNQVATALALTLFPFLDLK